ncbi:peptidase inhibitor family I36 protein [Streptomyces sp. NPDC059446]|uniref:peptidase inhibitor family I36 protein n=1 Tax=Streptomyces sp. NPDC059446 TaxID=3346833 RepID=UPI003690FF74
MRIARSVVALSAAACAALISTSAAVAAPAPAPASAFETTPEIGILTPEAEAELYEQLEESAPVIAVYRGKEINLANGWEGAQACTEIPSGEIYCYDSTAAADAELPAIDPAQASRIRSKVIYGPTAFSSCAVGYVCLWENSNGGGRRLQWSAKGTKQLSDWDFRDKASSGCSNRNAGGVEVYDARTALPDPYMILGSPYCYNFSSAAYPTGGTFNDKADYIKIL